MRQIPGRKRKRKKNIEYLSLDLTNFLINEYKDKSLLDPMEKKRRKRKTKQGNIKK